MVTCGYCSHAGYIRNSYSIEFIRSSIFAMAGHCPPVHRYGTFVIIGMDDIYHSKSKQACYIIKGI